jgi:hypothetical protein
VAFAHAAWKENDDLPDQVATLVIGKERPTGSGRAPLFPCTPLRPVLAHSGRSVDLLYDWAEARCSRARTVPAAAPAVPRWRRVVIVSAAGGLSATRTANPGVTFLYLLRCGGL